MGETEAFVLQLDRLKKSHQKYSHKTGEEGKEKRNLEAPSSSCKDTKGKGQKLSSIVEAVYIGHGCNTFIITEIAVVEDGEGWPGGGSKACKDSADYYGPEGGGEHEAEGGYCCAEGTEENCGLIGGEGICHHTQWNLGKDLCKSIHSNNNANDLSTESKLLQVWSEIWCMTVL